MKRGHLKTQTVTQNELYPLHLLINKVSSTLIEGLPAGHSLTGCDTVAKVGTKSSLLKMLETDGSLLHEFGREDLHDDLLMKAEQFLVKVVATKSMSNNCSTFDELRVRMYLYSMDKIH